MSWEKVSTRLQLDQIIKYKVTKSDYPLSKFPTVRHSSIKCGQIKLPGRGRVCLLRPVFVISMWVRRAGHGRPILVLSLSCEEFLLFPHIPQQGMSGRVLMWEARSAAGMRTCAQFWFLSTQSSWFREGAVSQLLGDGGALGD